MESATTLWNGFPVPPSPMMPPIGGSFPEWKPEMQLFGGAQQHSDVIGSSFRMHHLLLSRHQKLHEANNTSQRQQQQQQQLEPSTADDVDGLPRSISGRNPRQSMTSSAILIPDSTTAPVGTGTSRVFGEDTKSERTRAARSPATTIFAESRSGTSAWLSSLSAGDSQTDRLHHQRPRTAIDSQTMGNYRNGRYVNK